MIYFCYSDNESVLNLMILRASGPLEDTIGQFLLQLLKTIKI